jgi:hypothetical protein
VIPQFGDVRLPERFWSKVQPCPMTGCWLWTSAFTVDDYGVFWVGPAERSARIHRLAYELLVGPIPEGLTIDHLCRVRSCCNPTHLEPVTNRENQLRGLTFGARNASVTHCPAGHEYNKKNTRVGRNPGDRPCRVCRACQRSHQKAFKARRKEAA